MLGAITVGVHEVWSVDADGTPNERVEQRQTPWSCIEHGMSFGEWKLVVNHLVEQHGYLPNGNTPPTGGHRDFVSTSENLGMSIE